MMAFLLGGFIFANCFMTIGTGNERRRGSTAHLDTHSEDKRCRHGEKSTEYGWATIGWTYNSELLAPVLMLSELDLPKAMVDSQPLKYSKKRSVSSSTHDKCFEVVEVGDLRSMLFEPRST